MNKQDTAISGQSQRNHESGHYVVTSHRPGGVLLSCRCSFLAPGSLDVVIVKSRRLEVRRFTVDRNLASRDTRMNHDDSLFPLILSVPIHGRITTLLPFRIPSSKTDLLFFTTDTQKYAVISYATSSFDGIHSILPSHAAPFNIITHVSGDLREYGISIRGRQAECGPFVAMEPTGALIALHLFDGFITILPINKSYKMSSALSRVSATAQTYASSSASTIHSDLLFPPFHCRIEEHTILSMSFLIPSSKAVNLYLPQITLLHQDAKGHHSIITHSVDLAGKALILNTLTNLTTTSHDANTTSRRGGSTKTPPPLEEQLRKNLVDGGSGIIIPIPPWDPTSQEEDVVVEKKQASTFPPDVSMMDSNNSSNAVSHLFGGLLIVGQKEITYLCSAHNATKTLPMAESYILSQSSVMPFVGKDRSKDPTVRFLMGNEFGQLFFLALERSSDQGIVTGLHMELVGTTSISSTLVYMAMGYCFVGSQFGDSQLIKIMDQPSPTREIRSSEESKEIRTVESSSENILCISILEDYTNLGPIVDFDLIAESFGPVTSSPENSQSMMVCASGTGKDGSVRMVRNGVGMREYASIDLPGIRGMWGIKSKFNDTNDSYLIQSYLGETRILGVVADDMPMDDENNSFSSHGNLEEVSLSGFDLLRTTLFVGNVAVPDETASLVVQVTDAEVRLLDTVRSECLEVWSPGLIEGLCDTESSMITIGAVNKFGQIILVLRGGKLIYLNVRADEISPRLAFMGSTTLQREVSCVDFETFTSTSKSANKSIAIAVGLWDDFSLKILSLVEPKLFSDVLMVNLGQERNEMGKELPSSEVGVQRHRMARSVRLVTLEAAASISTSTMDQDIMSPTVTSSARVNMLFVGLGDGGLISFVVEINSAEGGAWLLHSRKEISLGTREVGLVPFSSTGVGRKVCMLATGDRPTVIYLAGGGNSLNSNAKLCYSAIHVSSDAAIDQPTGTNSDLVVSFATTFYSSILFPTSAQSDGSRRSCFSLCVCDESTFRIGLIDDIQKLHVTSYKLGMAPRRITYFPAGHLICVGCIDDGVAKVSGPIGGEVNMGNCIRFFDEKSFEEVDRLDLEPFEMILSVSSMVLNVCDTDAHMIVPEKIIEDSETLKGNLDSFVIVGTAYAYPDEDEPTRGRILILKCQDTQSNLRVAPDTKPSRIALACELQVKGGVYSVCPFLNGSMLATVNSKIHLCRLVKVETEDSSQSLALKFIGASYHGHILSLIVKGLSNSVDDRKNGMQPPLAIVGDLMRSISVLQYSPTYHSLEEIARDYNQNWTTAIEMLSEDVYIGAENFHNLFVLRRNSKAQSEELRSRLDTVGAFHLGEMPNKILRGSLVIPTNTAASNTSEGILSSALPKPNVGSRTLLGTVDGTIGTILGLDGSTFKFLRALERSISRNIRSVGDLSNDEYRAFRGERSHFPSRGFVDGDYVETFLDLDQHTMEAVVQYMNQEGRWEVDRSWDSSNGHDEIEHSKRVSSSYTLTVDDVRDIVEDLSMMH